jgi:hypothetical protein
MVTSMTTLLKSMGPKRARCVFGLLILNSITRLGIIIVQCGAPVGCFLMPPLIALLMDMFTWRPTMLFCAAFLLVQVWVCIVNELCVTVVVRSRHCVALYTNTRTRNG